MAASQNSAAARPRRRAASRAPTRRSCCRASSPTIWTCYRRSRRALHAGLLSPQGKILFEFFVVKAARRLSAGDGARPRRRSSPKRLKMYKLRAEVDDRGCQRRLHACGDLGRLRTSARARTVRRRYASPIRALPALGLRDAGDADARDWVARRANSAERDAGGLSRPSHRARRAGGRQGLRLRRRVPARGRLSISSTACRSSKGCYVGQEVVSRMQNRGTCASACRAGRRASGRCRRGRRRSPPAASRSARSARSPGARGAGTAAARPRRRGQGQRRDADAPAACAIRMRKPAWARFGLEAKPRAAETS